MYIFCYIFLDWQLGAFGATRYMYMYQLPRSIDPSPRLGMGKKKEEGAGKCQPLPFSFIAT
jgi:hypothetical protein